MIHSPQNGILCDLSPFYPTRFTLSHMELSHPSTEAPQCVLTLSDQQLRFFPFRTLRSLVPSHRMAVYRRVTKSDEWERCRPLPENIFQGNSVSARYFAHYQALAGDGSNTKNWTKDGTVIQICYWTSHGEAPTTLLRCSWR